MNKKWAIALYVTYSVTLILVLSLGGPVSVWLSDCFKSIAHHKNIDDVTVDFDVEMLDGGILPADRQFKFDFTVIGDKGAEEGLQFESLTPEVLKIIGGNKNVYTYSDFDGITTNAEIRITSKYDLAFEKIIDVEIGKVYPETFEVKYFVPGCGYDLPILVPGMAVYPYSRTDEDGCILEYEIIYDEEYFSYDPDRKCYVAIKETSPGKTVCFSAIYPNGRRMDSASFTVGACSTDESFEGILVNGEAVESITVTTLERIFVLLYSGYDTIFADVDITYTDPDNISIDRAGNYYFDKPSDHVFTFTLPNGFSKDLTVHVRNKMALPTLEENSSVNDHRITLSGKDAATFHFKYPEGVTYTDVHYEYDYKIAGIIEEWNGFKISPNKYGSMTLKVILDDGYERLEDTYYIEIVTDTSLKARIDSAIETFVSKILGHTMIFAVLGVLTLNLFRYINIEDKRLKIALYIASVLPTAGITELIQLAIPGRFGRFKDVLIDTCGFLLGTALTLLIVYIVRKKREGRAVTADSEEKTETVEETAESAE